VSRVVNIRGTSGSGKSYIVQALMARCLTKPEYLERHVGDGLFGPVIETSPRPIGYRCTHAGRAVWVAGGYETQNGGCDALMREGGTRDSIYAKLRERAADGDVLFEGLLISEVRRCVELAAMSELTVIHLDVSLDDCLAAVRARRSARGDERPLSTFKTTVKHKEIANQLVRLREAGVDVRSVDRADGLRLTLAAFGLDEVAA